MAYKNYRLQLDSVFSKNYSNTKHIYMANGRRIVTIYMIEHGIAQHSGRHTGTTAAPDLLELFDLLAASYSYLPLALA